MLWDIAGRSHLDALNMTYLRGASALLLVADGTRERSLHTALNLLMQARTLLPDVVAVLAINKLDLVEQWEVAPAALEELRRTLSVHETSARSGEGVEGAFADIATRLAA